MKRFFLGEPLFLARPFLGEPLFLRPLRAGDAALFLEIVQIVEQLPAVHGGIRSGRYDRAVRLKSVSLTDVYNDCDDVVPVKLAGGFIRIRAAYDGAVLFQTDRQLLRCADCDNIAPSQRGAQLVGNIADSDERAVGFQPQQILVTAADCNDIMPARYVAVPEMIIVSGNYDGAIGSHSNCDVVC